MLMRSEHMTFRRRDFLASATAGVLACRGRTIEANEPTKKARIAITFDLEMSRMYPTRDIMEWDYQKGNLNEPTKQYSRKAAQIVHDKGGVIHFFCVGRVLEQANVDWLKQIAEMGHPIGNHTYDHVNVWTTEPTKTQYRFQRSPWLIKGRSSDQIIRDNIRMTTDAMKQRLGIVPDGFRTPGGSTAALNGREDIQQILLDEGFQWVSSRYPPHKYSKPGTQPSDEVFESIVDALQRSQPYVYPTGLIELPISPISDVGAFRSSRWKRKDFLKSVQQCVEWAISNGGMFDFLCHPSIMYVEDPDFETVNLICDLVNDAGDKAEVVGLSAIAEDVKT